MGATPWEGGGGKNDAKSGGHRRVSSTPLNIGGDALHETEEDDSMSSTSFTGSVQTGSVQTIDDPPAFGREV